MDASNTINWVAPKEEKNSTLSFKEIKSGIYTATPLRKINTQYDKQLIVKLESKDKPSIEVYVPNSYVKTLLSLFHDEVNHVHLLKYDGYTETKLKNKTINKYNYQIAPLPNGDKVVDLEVPVKDMEWKVADTKFNW